jgi:hypothetical protein
MRMPRPGHPPSPATSPPPDLVAAVASPRAGTGRLLWMLERTLEPQNHRTRMSGLWRRARAAGSLRRTASTRGRATWT